MTRDYFAELYVAGLMADAGGTSTSLIGTVGLTSSRPRRDATALRSSGRYRSRASILERQDR